MQDSEKNIPKAKSYVSASNAHDVSTIGPMLALDCRYISTGVGEHRGKTAILAMMAGFFSSNPDVHWDVPEYRLEGQQCVAFDFTISTDGQSNRGLEKISFTEDGLISVIEVIR